MLLKCFRVKNFKNFAKEFVFDFARTKDYSFNGACLKDGLVKDAIIYGRNAVGKTNFGLAMFDITYHLVDKQRHPRMLSNYLNADSEEGEASFQYEFASGSDTFLYDYRKTSATELSYERLQVNGKTVFSFNFLTEERDFSHLQEFGLSTLNWEFRDKGVSLLRYMANNLVLPAEHPVMQIMNFVDGMLWFASLGAGNYYVGFSSKVEVMTDFIIREGLVGEFETFLNQYGVDEKIKPMKNPDGSTSLYFVHKKLVPFSMASSGTASLMTFFYWYKHIQKITFLFIDEFDAFYHYELAEKIIQLLRDDIDVQAVLTSQNTALMANRFMRPDCYFILTRDRLVSLADATQRELRQGHNLEKLYMSGEFDA